MIVGIVILMSVSIVDLTYNYHVTHEHVSLDVASISSHLSFQTQAETSMRLRSSRDVMLQRCDDLKSVVVDAAAPLSTQTLVARVPDDAREMIQFGHDSMYQDVGVAGCLTLSLFMPDVVANLHKLGRGQSTTSIDAAIKIVVAKWMAKDDCEWQDESDQMMLELTSVKEFDDQGINQHFMFQTLVGCIRRWLSRQPKTSTVYQRASVAGGQALFLHELIQRVMSTRSMSEFNECRLRSMVRAAVRAIMTGEGVFNSAIDGAYAQQVGYFMGRIVEIYDNYVESHGGTADAGHGAFDRCKAMLSDGLMGAFKKVGREH